jgi:aquacobalamin reductase/NAD(P)H-flavin reductase
MSEISCQVVEIAPLTHSVKRVLLAPATPLIFKAGQYLQVVMGEKDLRPFSIANAPNDSNMLELHIGAGQDNSYANEVLERMQQHGCINIDGAHGNAYLRDSISKPVILLAGGTGFSYTYAILQKLLMRPRSEPIFLYWGTRTIEDMYAFDELCLIEKSHRNFKFMPVLEQASENWTGRTGWVHKAILKDFVSLEPYQVYVAGRFEMAGVARQDFHQKGLLLANLFGDAYQFI